MRRIISILTLCIGICMNADAQTFTQRIQKKVAGQGTVVIHQDSTIERLVNTAPLGIKSSQPTATTPSAQTTTAPKTPTTVIQTDTIDTSKKVMRGGAKVNGYRVQAFAGGNSRTDRQQAERIGNDIKSHFGGVPVYVHFYSPRWICRVGNYRTYEEAHQMLVSLRKLGYTQATIVKGKITVAAY